MPGDTAMQIELITPVAIEEGLRFAIRGRWKQTVGPEQLQRSSSNHRLRGRPL